MGENAGEDTNSSSVKLDKKGQESTNFDREENGSRMLTMEKNHRLKAADRAHGYGWTRKNQEN